MTVFTARGLDPRKSDPRAPPGHTPGPGRDAENSSGLLQGELGALLPTPPPGTYWTHQPGVSPALSFHAVQGGTRRRDDWQPEEPPGSHRPEVRIPASSGTLRQPFHGSGSPWLRCYLHNVPLTCSGVGADLAFTEISDESRKSLVSRAPSLGGSVCRFLFGTYTVPAPQTSSWCATACRWLISEETAPPAGTPDYIGLGWQPVPGAVPRTGEL